MECRRETSLVTRKRSPLLYLDHSLNPDLIFTTWIDVVVSSEIKITSRINEYEKNTDQSP